MRAPDLLERFVEKEKKDKRIRNDAQKAVKGI
jgi:hypothetical protein